MIFFLSFFFGCIFLIILYYDKYFRQLSNSIVFFGICLLFIFFVGFRYDMGTDYWSYYRVFHGVHEAHVASDFGFQFLIRIYRIFSNSFNGFIFLLAFISIYTKYLFFKKLENPFFALFIYIAIFSLGMGFNIMRQGMAAAVVFHAVYWAEKRNIIASFLLICIASVIHISSLIFLPLYFIISRNIKIKTSNVFIIILVAFMIRFYLMEVILSIFEPFLERISGVQGIGRIAMYLRIREIYAIDMGAIRRIVMCILFIILNNKKYINNVYFNLYLLGTVIFILFMGYGILAYRLSLVFDVFLIPLFANIKIAYNYRNIAAIIVFVAISFVLYWITINSETANLLPYRTFLSYV